MSPRLRFTLLAVLALAALCGLSSAQAFALTGYHWPNDTDIVIHLQLSRPAVPLQDGSASWNASAADALNIWNQQLGSVGFVPDSTPASPSGGDGANSVFFSNTVYGDSFGANTLAITIVYSGGTSVTSEADVIFNNNRQWNSYRGPQQGAGANATFDLHRVALHEFGHVFGLDHPDQQGQSVTAIMNSIISNLDALAQDDIDGAGYLYRLRLTSDSIPQVGSGDPFAYQITANNGSTTFSASGLPPGMQLDASTGVISGHCPTSGDFPVNIVVQGARGPLSAQITIRVYRQVLTSAGYFQAFIGDNISYQVTADNHPTSFSATGLPAGLTIDSATGLISGTPQATGSFDVLIHANSATSEAGGWVRIYISPPAITSTSTPPEVELGDPFTYQITASHSTSSYAASNLPAGLQLNASTGVISGTVASAGYYDVTLTAYTTRGEATGWLMIVVRAPRVTSSLNQEVDIGSVFSYQITASNHPTSFDASPLPAGLQFDSGTGLISGHPELSGQYQMAIAAQGNVGTASGTLLITVRSLEVITPPLAIIPNASGGMVADPGRSRIYVGSYNSPSSISIIDTTAMQVTQTIALPSLILYGLTISADGNKLWLVGYGGDSNAIKALDLNTLNFRPDLPADRGYRTIREGADGRLYTTPIDANDTGIFQIDAQTGAVTAHFGSGTGNYNSPVWIELSPDRSVLYATSSQAGETLARFQLVSGSTPRLLQHITDGPTDFSSNQVLVNPNGQSVGLLGELTNDHTTAAITLRSPTDLTATRFGFSFPAQSPGGAYGPDGAFLFLADGNSASFSQFETTGYRMVRNFALHGYHLATGNFAVDRTNTKLFVDTNAGVTYVYPAQPPARPPVPAHSLLNVSTRLRTQPGDNVLIGGFIITGNQPKKIVARAIGPSLPVNGPLADPILQLRGSDGALIAQNDNWNAHRADVLETHVPPLDEHESAIVATLQPGAYTTILSGVASTSGVALVEIYDLDPGTSRIGNISTRGKVETGDNVMIGGFIIGGDQPTKVIVRAIGPSLASQSVAGPLPDTVLSMYDGNGTQIAQNDDWQTTQRDEIIASTVPPSDPRESAIVRTLQPGAYTAIVSGKNSATGVALVEVYNLD